MKKLFKWLLILTASITVGIVIFLYNPGLIKGPLERYLSDLTGYSISLEGDLNIDVGRTTGLSATNIHIAGPGWAGHRNLVAVGGLGLTLDTGSLFEDIIVLESLQVDDLQLNLETDIEGLGNWLGANEPVSDASEKADEAVVIVRDITVGRATIRYLNGKTDVEHLLYISSFNQQQHSNGMLHINLDGDLNDSPIKFTGNMGPYVNLLKGRNINFAGSGHLGTLQITASGIIDDLLEPNRPQFRLEMQGPNIDEVTAMFSLDDLGSGEFSLVAKGDEINHHYEVDINGDVGDISLGVSARVSDLSKLDEVNLELVVNGPSLGAFTRTFGIEDWPDKPFYFEGDIERLGGTLNLSGLTLDIGGTHLTLDALLTNFPSLEASRIKLAVSGDDVTQFRELLGISGAATGHFEISGNLDVSPNNVELVQIKVQTSLGQATLSGNLGAAPSYTGSNFHLHLQGHNAHTLMSAFNVDALPEQPFSLDTRIEIVEEGMLIEHGVLVTIEDERLELGGFVAFNPSSQGTDLDVRFSGQHLAQVVRRLVGDSNIPDQPYDLSGRLRVMKEGIHLENVKAEFADIELTASGLVGLEDNLLGTEIDFQFSGQALSTLGTFAATGDSLDIFVPGLSYRAAGALAIDAKGWLLNGITGSIGDTHFNVDGRISNQPEWTGSNVSFSVEGSGLDGLLVDPLETDLLNGAFESSGQVALSEDTLSITGFIFENVKAHGEVDLKLGWPASSNVDADFDLSFWGEDLRQVMPPMESFEPAMVPYKIEAKGKKQGDLLSLEHANADVGNLKIVLKDGLNDDLTDESLDITFNASSKDISTLGRLNGEHLPSLALNLDANFKGNAHQFVLSKLKGSLGDSQLEGSLDVSLNGPKPIIKLTASSNYIDIRPFLNLEGSENETGESKADPDRLIPATPLPMDTLAATDMTIRLDIAELRHTRDSIRNLLLEARIAAGGLEISQLSAEGPRGKLSASMSIKPIDTNNADVKIHLNTDKFVLNLGRQPKDKLHQVPAFDVQLSVNGKGSNLQELAGSLNGTLYLGSEGGILEGVNLSILDTFILDEIFGLITPKTEPSNDLFLGCAATILEITDGLVETNPALAFTTDRITLVTKGTLDLKTEKMKFNFNATPNKALQISASELFNPFILVGGTLSEPVVGLDPAKVLLHGSAAVGTAGLSILAKGLLDRVGNTVPVCEEMLKRDEQEP